MDSSYLHTWHMGVTQVSQGEHRGWALGVTVVWSLWRWVRQPLQGQPQEGRGSRC